MPVREAATGRGPRSPLRHALVLLLAPAGIAVGHVVAYLLAHHDHDARHDALAGHGYFEFFAGVAALCALGVVVRAVTWERRGQPGRLRVRLLALAQMSGFLLLEVGERAVAGVGPSAVLHEPAVWLGLGAQALVAGGLAVVVRTLVPLVAAFLSPRLVLCLPAAGPLRPQASVTRRASTSSPRSPRTSRGPPTVVTA